MPAFPRDKHLTAIAVAYKNPDVSLIADAVLPRVPVGKRTFEYTSYPIEQAYSVPDTRVGEKSQVPRLELNGTQASATVDDYGLEIPITKDDQDNAPSNIDPKQLATERATNLVLLDREARVARTVFNPASYPASQKTQLAGAAQWSDVTSSPLKAMLDALDGCLIRPNVLVFGQAAWSVLSMHPKLVKAAGGDSGEGRITRERLAELLEVTEVLVGAAQVNSVKPGKAPVLARIWGKHALAFYRDRTVGTTGGITFGITAQYGDRIAGSQEVDMGLRGGTAVRSGESVKELIIAPHASFFWQDAVA